MTATLLPVGAHFDTHKSSVPREGKQQELEDLKNSDTLSTLPAEVSPGIIIDKDYQEESSLLKAKRLGKMGLTTGAVFFQGWAAIDLLLKSFKLFTSNFGHGDVDESYHGLSKAYTKSAIAGTLTGLANESPYWALGNLGMGFFSRFLDNVAGLAGFSIFDGLASIGMGQVRYRDKQNAYAVQHSLFNNPKLSFLKPLMPIEQSIISFCKKVGSLDFKRFFKDEPYAFFQNAGGGLILSGLLGLATIPIQKVFNLSKSLSYLPFSLFSGVNLVALFRDGSVVNERATDFGGRDKAETFLMKLEGKSKMLASPILGLNNLLLAFKGLGIDTEGGMLYNLAMSIRSASVAVASIAFGAQSATKYINPDTFGPFAKRIVKVILNPKEVKKEIQEFLTGVEKDRKDAHKSDHYQVIIDSEPHKILFNSIEKTELFQSLKKKSQAGLASPMARDRAFLERFTHSTRVGAIGILMLDSLIQNTQDSELKQYLKENELAFKLSCYLHDIGHIMRSHLAEKGVKGHDNDELTVKLLKKSEIVDVIEKYCTNTLKMNESETEVFLQKIRDIVGHKSPLSKVLKICDFTEYIRGKGSDFNSAAPEVFKSWEVDQILDYANTLRIFKNDENELKIAFTEDGAAESLRLYHDRLRFNKKFNSTPVINSREIAYLLGLEASDVSLDEVMAMDEESELDETAYKGIEKLNGDVYSFKIRTTFGGKKAYCGWNEEKNGFHVLTSQGVYKKVFDYLDEDLKFQDKDRFDELNEIRKVLTTPEELELKLEVVGDKMYKELLQRKLQPSIN